MEKNYIPIVCFAYSRPKHLNNMLSSLEKNSLSEFSDVTIYINGKEKNTNISNWEEVIEVASRNWNFKSLTVNVREKNIGAKNNIIQGITEMFSSNSKLIILEDDLILGNHFLDFMNYCLNKYEDDDNIWHVNGWSYPQLFSFKSRAAVSYFMSPWGWGTWSENWKVYIDEKHYEKNLISSLSKKERKFFNMYGGLNWENMIIKDQDNQDNAWDCYWYQAIFLNNGKTIFPYKTHVFNDGFDGTGLHCGRKVENYPYDKTSNNKKTSSFPDKTNSISLLYDLNLRYFNRKINILDYINFHKSKFSTFKNFKEFVSKKIIK
tara:strand:- start:349 stop:1308 length:960 start_codon:yes stop_codon:yes gene_type:complete